MKRTDEHREGSGAKGHHAAWVTIDDPDKANMPHEFQGVAEGTADRDCTLCNRPDRDPIHDAVTLKDGAVVSGQAAMLAVDWIRRDLKVRGE